jgi:type IV secretion system protein VirD4
VWWARQSQLVTTYGSARWASAKEIKSAGLFAAKGVFLGRLENNYLRHDGPEHVMCFAPTRSGKGVGLVLPTLLATVAWPLVQNPKLPDPLVEQGFSHPVCPLQLPPLPPLATTAPK